MEFTQSLSYKIRHLQRKENVTWVYLLLLANVMTKSNLLLSSETKKQISQEEEIVHVVFKGLCLKRNYLVFEIYSLHIMHNHRCRYEYVHLYAVLGVYEQGEEIIVRMNLLPNYLRIFLNFTVTSTFNEIPMAINKVHLHHLNFTNKSSLYIISGFMRLPVIGGLENSTKRRGTKTIMNLALLFLLCNSTFQLI